MASMIDLDYDWEAERKARIAHRRRLWFAKWFALFAYAVLVIGFVAAIAVLAWIGINRERFERAAYNEGRYGVSREVALKLADQGVGMCAEEILQRGRDTLVASDEEGDSTFYAARVPRPRCNGDSTFYAARVPRPRWEVR